MSHLCSTLLSMVIANHYGSAQSWERVQTLTACARRLCSLVMKLPMRCHNAFRTSYRSPLESFLGVTLASTLLISSPTGRKLELSWYITLECGFVIMLRSLVFMA